ncbi:hypothetical protein [Rhizobium favelukesii]|uniref:hypothetical protein n=1 Tax=Rhizobium favelukesii TaxID=348824 RepID=UPI0003FC6552|nr:hypothetical protein [Rhizobium favelukesii]
MTRHRTSIPGFVKLTIPTTQRVSSKSDKTSGAYKSAGTLSDGVVVLTPKSKPTHFTSREIKTTIEKVRRDASTGRFLDVADTKK